MTSLLESDYIHRPVTSLHQLDAANPFQSRCFNDQSGTRQIQHHCNMVCYTSTPWCNPLINDDLIFFTTFLNRWPWTQWTMFSSATLIAVMGCLHTLVCSFVSDVTFSFYVLTLHVIPTETLKGSSEPMMSGLFGRCWSFNTLGIAMELY